VALGIQQQDWRLHPAVVLGHEGAETQRELGRQLQSFSGDRRVGPNPEALVGGIERVGHDLDPLPHEGATTILEVD